MRADLIASLCAGSQPLAWKHLEAGTTSRMAVTGRAGFLRKVR